MKSKREGLFGKNGYFLNPSSLKLKELTWDLQVDDILDIMGEVDRRALRKGMIERWRTKIGYPCSRRGPFNTFLKNAQITAPFY